MSSLCGSTSTLDGHPCENPVDASNHCAAGHPCVPRAASIPTKVLQPSVGGLDFESVAAAPSAGDTFDFSTWHDVVTWAHTHDIELDWPALEKGNTWAPLDMNAVAAAIEQADEAFPGLASRISRITYGALLGEAAHVGIDESPMHPVAGTITVHLHAKDARVRESHAKDPRQVASDLGEAVLHEMGHVREFSTPWMRHRAGAGLDVAKTMNPAIKRGIIRQAMIDAGYADRRGSIDRTLVSSDISRYACTSDAEMHAEVFCLMLRPGGVDDRPIAARERIRAFWESLERQTEAAAQEVGTGSPSNRGGYKM